MSNSKAYSLKDKRIWVAGQNGMVGRALVRRLEQEDCIVLSLDRHRLDLRRQADVEAWLADAKPQVVILAAARVGGIHANDTYPADFIYDNLAIETNVIQAAHLTGVQKLLFLGSSCVYPRDAPQPISENALLSGPLEPTNEWYAIAKIAGIKLCQAYRRQHKRDFISVMPANLYGPGDNFHPENSHVPAALLRRFHEAKAAGQDEVVVWGTGKPRREFLYIDDLADACVHLLKHYSGEQPINIGTGLDLTISDFAAKIARIVGFKGRITYDPSRPDGTPVKVLDVRAINDIGWTAPTTLERGIELYYEWFLENTAELRG